MKTAFRQVMILLPMMLALTGCRRDMYNQPKSNPLRESDFFADGAASRPLPANVVVHEDINTTSGYADGLTGTNPVTAFPFSVTRKVLERGRERFEISCVPCHGRSGEGDGAVVRRGFPAPPSYHIDRLREAPIGHFVEVMAHGYGAMYPQAERVSPEDRWAIAAYIRALQLSQQAPVTAVPPVELARLKSAL